MKYRDATERFFEKVVKSDNCWVWSGSTAHFGHGQFWANDKHYSAHRWSWEFHNGPIPEALCVCHHCDNPPCVNPTHLFLGTRRDNYLDAVKKGRMAPPARIPWHKRKGEGRCVMQTHCIRGHEKTPQNTFRVPGKGVACRTCRNMSARDSKRRARARKAAFRG